MNIGDNFKKIIVVKDMIKPWITEEGISVDGIMDFLLNPNSLDLWWINFLNFAIIN